MKKYQIISIICENREDYDYESREVFDTLEEAKKAFDQINLKSEMTKEWRQLRPVDKNSLVDCGVKWAYSIEEIEIDDNGYENNTGNEIDYKEMSFEELQKELSED